MGSSNVHEDVNQLIINKSNTSSVNNSRRTKFKISKNKIKSNPVEASKPNHAKMSAYVFKRNELNALGAESTNQDESSEKTKENLTEENNMLIEQMFKNKKRQFSYTKGLESMFQNKLRNKAKPKRRVVKRFINNKPVRINATINKQDKDTESDDSKNDSHGNIVWFTTFTDAKDSDIKEPKFKSQASSSKQLGIYVSESTKHSNNASIMNQENVVKSKLRSVLDTLKPQILEKQDLSSLTNNADTQASEKKVTETEKIIAESIAKLAKINEENDTISDNSSDIKDPSPKINVQIKDTWGEGETEKGDDT